MSWCCKWRAPSSASARGIRIAASDAVRTSLKVGEPCRIEIDGGPNAEVAYVGDVRNMEDGSVGIELRHEVPLAGTTPPGAGASEAHALERRRSEEVLQNIVAHVSAATREVTGQGVASISSNPNTETDREPCAESS